MTTEYHNPAQAWFATLGKLLTHGDTHSVAPRGQGTTELIGPEVFTLANTGDLALEADGRAFRHVIGVAEGLSLVGQVSIPEVIVDKVAAFRKFMTRSIFWGAYGPRVAGDVGNVVELLKRDRDSRQAVLTIFDSDRDLMRTDQADLPCTVSLMYQVRDDRLDTWTVMRSNDAWLGLPYDLMQFGMLQHAIAQALDLPAGFMTHSAFSMHLYDRDVPKALEVRSARAHGFEGPLWGGSGDINETASRARRLLLGQWSRLDQMTEFEGWCAELMDDAIKPRPLV